MKNRQLLSNAAFAIFCMAGAVSAWALTSGKSTSSRSADRKPAAAAQKTQTRSDHANYVGCLRAEDGGERFVLADVDGPDAPKSRNWKTAFITRTSGKLEVVGSGLRLSDRVGQRVQVTGRRADRVIRATAIKTVGGTCG